MSKLIFVAALAASCLQAAHWVRIGTMGDGLTWYGDTESRSYRTSNHDTVAIWVKEVQKSGDYSLYRYELRRAHFLRVLQAVNYDASGGVLSSGSTLTGWDEIVPDSAGEFLYNWIFPARGTK